jgi:pimeloyl-ACP methyl ester carboxylesterase
MTLPSLLIVHGAWHRPEHFRLLLDELSDVDGHVVSLASCGSDPSRLGGMYDDAKLIADAVAAIDGPVVVVAHSYGGVPTTQALGGVPNVKRIVYLAAFLLDVGASLFGTDTGVPTTWSALRRRDGAADHVEVVTPIEMFYADVDPAIAAQAVSQLCYLSCQAGLETLTQVAWETVPSTYVICESDHAIAPSTQEVFAQRADRVRRLNSSHSPFLSQPAALARLLREELASAD